MSNLMMKDKEWLETTWEKFEKKLRRVTIKSRYKIPYTTENGIHDVAQKNINNWTNGFWGGLNWLMYIGTKDEEYKTTALCSEKIMDEALGNYKELFHDVGFMWHILSGVNYRVTGDMAACNKT